MTATLPVSNQGNRHDLHLSGFAFSNPAFSFITPPDSLIKSDSVKNWAIQFLPSQTNQNYSGTLTFSSDDPAIASVSVALNGTSTVTANEAPADHFISIYPNPTNGSFFIKGIAGEYAVQANDMEGKMISLLREGNQWIFPENVSGVFVIRIDGIGMHASAVKRMVLIR